MKRPEVASSGLSFSFARAASGCYSGWLKNVCAAEPSSARLP
jgi:hypothetical protein